MHHNWYANIEQHLLSLQSTAAEVISIHSTWIIFNTTNNFKPAILYTAYQSEF